MSAREQCVVWGECATERNVTAGGGYVLVVSVPQSVM